MAHLVVGPILRHVAPDPCGTATATVWVQADAPCTVEVAGPPGIAASSRTFALHGHHYALVDVPGLPPGSVSPYSVRIDGQPVWPPGDSRFPPPAIRVPAPGDPVRLVFGSCRTSVPHDEQFNARYGVDVLRAYARRLADLPHRGAGEPWPTLLLMLGDQVYADETSPAIQEFIAARRDAAEPPGLELADFQEYAEVYRLAWGDPAIRWLLASVPSAMIFDDHDIRDDWNTSAAWRDAMAAQPWWRDRIVGGLAAYWVYQHLGNLPPNERDADSLLRAVRACDGDAGHLVDAFAAQTDARPESGRWSYVRDIGGVRLVVLDCRAARVLDPDARAMLDDAEMAWVDAHLTGDVDHLLLATSVPFLLPTGLHEIEGWNEAVCAGAWGRAAAAVGERIRQGADLEHWGAFRRSFGAVTRMVAEVAVGRRGRPPATVAFLSGDVHNSYLARVAPPGRGPGEVSPIYQLVCSPVRNELPRVMRWANRAACSRVATVVGSALARAAGVPRGPMRWSVDGEQRFVNSLATLELTGRGALVRWETAVADGTDARMSELTSSRLA